MAGLSDGALKVGEALGEFVALFDLSSTRREKTSIRASIVSSRALTRSKRWLMEWWRSRNSRSSRRRHVTSFGREEQVPGLVEPREGIGSMLLDAENNLGIGALLGGMCWAVTERIVIDG
jgi:hypothetical protein